MGDDPITECVLRPQVGVGVIVIKGAQVLLGLRRNSHGPGTWSFPGGHLDFGETVEQCALREVFEETGLVVSQPSLGPYTNDLFEQEGKHYVTLFVLARHKSGVPAIMEPDKCDEWRWFPWGKFPSPLFLPILNLLKTGFTPDIASA